MGFPVPDIQGYAKDKAEAGKANKAKQAIMGEPTVVAKENGTCIKQDSIQKAADRSTSTPLSNDMPFNGHNLSLDTDDDKTESIYSEKTSARPPLVWDWGAEHEDRKRERKTDNTLRGLAPFEVDRKVLKDVVREKMGIDVGRITFLSAGTFHKAYLITLVNHIELVARVARRYMPRLKVESEVATMRYLREKTDIPVPTVYHHDSNPYNRLGGEFILMSKAPGIPLAEVFHSLCYNDLLKLLKNTARLIIPLFAHRFPRIGSLYVDSSPNSTVSSGAPTPRASSYHGSFPFLANHNMSSFSSALTPRLSASLKMTPTPPATSVTSTTSTTSTEFHVGPIISWPFFGSNRGDLSHPHELNRGPWSSTQAYLDSCVEREIQGIIRENEGKSAPHRLHLDPDEIISSRHHRLNAVPGDESDDSDEYDLEESEEEWEGPGDAMYRDYRRMQRSTFLFTQLAQREDNVRKEMGRWKGLMERLVSLMDKRPSDTPEEFGLDCHDLSLENVFVDEVDHTKITCIIDWESTTTRPLWACAHLPAFVQSSPFVSRLFRQAVTELPNDPTVKCERDLELLCREWLYWESAGIRLRMAHRCAEWDGWEEGLVESILGPEGLEEEWLKFQDSTSATVGIISPSELDHGDHKARDNKPLKVNGTNSPSSHLANKVTNGADADERLSKRSSLTSISLKGAKVPSKIPIAVTEQAKEQMLATTGDICGGRGGELGRRLEAWLTVNGADTGVDGVAAAGAAAAILSKERWVEGERTAL